MQKKFLAISGPVDAPIGDAGSIEGIHAALRARAAQLDVQVDWVPFNGEGKLVDYLKKNAGTYAGAMIDAATASRSGDTLKNAIEAAPFPCVEVSVFGVRKGEESNHASPLTAACVGAIGGFGPKSYLLALEALIELTNA